MDGAQLRSIDGAGQATPISDFFPAQSQKTGWLGYQCGECAAGGLPGV